MAGTSGFTTVEKFEKMGRPELADAPNSGQTEPWLLRFFFFYFVHSNGLLLSTAKYVLLYAILFCSSAQTVSQNQSRLMERQSADSVRHIEGGRVLLISQRWMMSLNLIITTYPNENLSHDPPNSTTTSSSLSSSRTIVASNISSSFPLTLCTRV